MGADRPKQYLRLGSRTLLERSVECLLADARVAGVHIVVAAQERLASALALPEQCTLHAAGGATRAQSVRNGLRVLRERLPPDAWVLVHDAARPCLARDELAALIDTAGLDEHGGLLALPISDTIKRAEEGRVAQTVDRSGLWRALTPQFFRVDVLWRALEHGADQDAAVTDEAAAVELLGLRPRLITGSPGNIKVTQPADLVLAEAILKQQGRW